MQCIPLAVTALVILTVVTADPAPQFYNGDLLEPMNDEPFKSTSGLKTVKTARKTGGISLKDFDMFSPMNSQRDDANLKQMGKGTSFKRHLGLSEQAERVFNAGSDPAWSGGIKSSGQSSSSLKISSLKTSSLSFKGGCKDKPPTPANSMAKCSQYSGCVITCFEDHEFPDQSKKLSLVCENGAWKTADSKWDTVPDCQPICDPPCQNLGFCLAPNVCNCPDSHEGPLCETVKTQPCLDKPPVPMNSRVSCSVKECFASCNPGFQFPGGQKKMFMDCDAGTWVPRLQQFSRIPDCQPICTPPCENGGRCLPGNLCQCPQKFRGPQCNYPEENCNPDRMNFNGAYNCSGRGDTFSCSLSCGSQGTFDSVPAPIYTCEYATAIFTPQPIPQCIFEDGQAFYFKSNSSSHTSSEFHSGSSFEFSEWSSSHKQRFHHKSGGRGLKLSGSEQFFENFWSSENSGSFNINSHEYSMIREMSPIPGTCMAWGAGHYKTFDGKVYSFQSSCSYILLRDVVAGMFTIIYRTQGPCGTGSTCKRSITVLVEDDVYHLNTRDDGQPSLQRADYSIAIPGSVDGMVAERVANYVILRAEGFGFTVKWDTKSTVMIDVSEALWNRTAGLCGRINGFWMDDFENRDGSKSSSLLGFVNSWEADGLTESEKCLDNPSEHHPCKYDQADDQAVTDQASELCERILTDPKFEECRKVIDPRPYYETCRWDYCQCQEDDRRECACSGLERFFHECTRLGVDLPDGWRDATLCPVDCHDGRVYSMCGPTSDDTCHSVGESTRTAFCVEGCYCPKGSALHDGNCIPRSQCPCTLRKKIYQPGEQVPNDCNTCTCVAGEWQCTEQRCGSRCAARGDPHYTTFDGRHYDFMGKCSYYLMKGDNYSIAAENVACSGAISEAMNFPALSVSGLPSCTKSVTIRLNDDVIKLKQNRDVVVNGEEIATIPLWMDGIYIRHASSVFVSVELPNGLEVWWDGQSRVYIDATPEFFGKTQGLCGTFNENQRDDLTTPEGDVEQSVMAFANKWKTREVCQDVSLLEPHHPCEVNAHHRAEAEKYCHPIRGELFEKCHGVVDYEQYYKDCLYDVCACQGKLADCLCPGIASYAKECTAKGVTIDWLPEVRHCGLHCTGGQVYHSCGDSCGRSCYDIATYSKCRRKCVEGCNCPEGMALDDSGHCVPIHQCPCVHKDKEFPAGFKELRPGSRMPDLCTCMNARWSCRPATQQEQEEFTLATTPAVQCSADKNEEFTSCEPDMPITCKNMNDERPKKPSTNCRPGCKCKKGYVLDATSQTCIKPNECPCHHGGRSYSEGEQMAQDCNSCTCQAGKWLCTTHVCPGLCSNWGESHYKTFDGRLYDFHGNCDYMLAKGASSDPHDRFQITAQSVPCGSSGVACSKSLTLHVGGADSEETISLTRHKKIAMGQFSERILVRQTGVFIFVEVADLGLVLQWDHGTRVYLRLDPKWRGRVRGLCGNFNGNELDDFQPPTGGLTETSAKVFGDSWRLQTYCPESLDYVDTCTTHPHRKVWAVRNCNILKSELFEKCHSEVPVADYIERCVSDTCGCDMGGDCECLCTAFAAYAHECNLRGIHVKWRSQELCPMQCDEECSSYTPCMATCPAVTCENPFGITQLCKSDACVEGCQPRSCPPGHIHRSARDMSCMPTADCRAAICQVVDGVVYAEGDVMERDACHACYCSKGKKVCQGQPCLVITPATTPLPPTTIGRLLSCRTGWSQWFNSHQPSSDGDLFDVEPLPRDSLVISPTSPMCNPSMMVAIECRTVDSHISHQKTGDRVECGLPSGLRCTPGGIKGRSVCYDYEVRILCDCGEIAPVTPVIETTTEAATPPATPAPIVPVHCADGWTPWFNDHRPDSRGEYELTSVLRQRHSFCAAHQMADVECRPTDPSARSDDISGQPSCTKEGYRCRNPSPSTCTDHEIRFRCLCRCQDGLEIESPIRQMTASSFKDVQSRPENGFLASNKFWSPRRPYQSGSEWLQIDLLRNKEITGLMLQGNYITDEWVTRFTVQHSSDEQWWSSLMESEAFVPLIFPGNDDGHSVKRVLFPDSFFARYIRIVPVDYHQGISLRLQLLGCDVTTQPEPIVTVPTPLRCDPARPVKPHPTNCSMYYVCRELVHGTEDVERYCNPPTLFNPSTMVCDWPDSVFALRPECGMPTPAPERSTTPSCVDGWTDWFNTSHPADGGGDFELYDTVAAAHSICPKTHIYDIECKFYTNRGKGRPVLDDFSNSPDKLVSCKPTYGLICYNSNQDSGLCQDYAVRFLCGCQPKPTTQPPFRPPTTPRKGLTTPPTAEECPWEMEWQSCAYRCNQLCLEYKAVLQQRGYCSSSDDCAPGCVDVNSPCPRGFFWRDQRTCVSIHDCTCRSWNGQIVSPGAVVDESHCETCQCVDNEYVCDTSSCFDTTTPSSEAAQNLTLVTTRKAKTPGPVDVPTPCSYWSDWFNDNRPTSGGDKEFKNLDELKRSGFCAEGQITEIECRDALRDRSHSDTGDNDVACSMETGLSCVQSRQAKGGRCKDYKIRYYCDCIAPVETTTPTTTIMIWSTTPAQQLLCDDGNLIPLLADHRNVPDSAFVATSSTSARLGPSSARLDSSSLVSWVPARSNADQYIQVDLGRSQLVYGIDQTGSPVTHEYVTSLFVLYSVDNQRFSYVSDRAEKPMLFYGPLEHSAHRRSLFYHPVEARFIRLEPQTWKHRIALQFDVLGCSEAVAPVEPPVPVAVCVDQMGLENGLISDEQISVTSGIRDGIRLGSADSWSPTLDSRREHVRIDFMEPRNLSGIVTQGHHSRQKWVEAFSVRYSTDGHSWSDVLSDDGHRRIFPANIDNETPHTNTFERLISARFLEIIPWQWHNGIALRLDVLGCYVPVSTPSTIIRVQTTPLPTTPSAHCNLCPNVPPAMENLDACGCPPDKLWDGNECVKATQCPCFEGLVRYAVGSVHQSQDCSVCVCGLGGIIQCRRATCPPCAPGLRSVLSDPPSCKCQCEQCKEGTRLCPSSNICLDSHLWCNGVEDCPDDEKECATTTPAPTCVQVTCSFGYTSSFTGLVDSKGCPIINCMAEKVIDACKKPECPFGYTVEYEEEDQQTFQSFVQLFQVNQCPKYSCVPLPTTPPPPPLDEVHVEDKCSMTSRLFETLDGAEFAYDICNHVLARDRDGSWSVTVHKNCADSKTCSRSLRINHGRHTVEFLSNLQVLYNNFTYTAVQAEKIGSGFSAFSIVIVGDSLLFRSKDFDFWALWDVNMNAVIGVPRKLVTRVDGLCGFYNRDVYDDKRTPSGELAASTQDFGDSWSLSTGADPSCQVSDCPIQVQKLAWEKCSFLKASPFDKCSTSPSRAVGRCVEIMCDCMRTRQVTECDESLGAAGVAECEQRAAAYDLAECGCRTMTTMASECRNENPSVDLSGWRTKYDCLVDCPNGAIYKECSKRACEITCANKKDPNACPEIPDLCIPGCVCPDGLVRKHDRCVKPNECRDCVCDGFGDPQYFSFDRQNFTFNGNCTYIAARDKLITGDGESSNRHDFQVLVTNKECAFAPATTCTEAVTVLYQDHVIEMRRSDASKTVIASVDGQPVDKFPHHLPWMRMEKLVGEQVTVLLVAIQVEVSYFFHNFAFSVRVPSQLYLNKTEGLCGNCNGNSGDDMCKADGQLTDDVNDFGLSWLVKNLLREPVQKDEEFCQVQPQPECIPPPPEDDLCLKLVDHPIFKMCNAVVDPASHLSACQYDQCYSSNKTSASCNAMEAYARECAKFGVCLAWRSPELCPIDCPGGMEYRQCGSGCVTNCRNHKEQNCTMSTIDGCYCPEGEAFNEALGRCVPTSQCIPCDTNGHFPGDSWSENGCTSCTCDHQGRLLCSTKQCVLESCKLGEKQIVQDPPEGECCPSVFCSPDQLTDCSNVSTPVCGPHQHLKFQELYGCLRQVCECVPLHDCPQLVHNEPLVGEKYVLNETGCCPHWTRICTPDECPAKPECPTFYELTGIPGTENHCCPESQCTPPKDGCVYELTDGEVRKFAVGDTWSDGPCTHCRCDAGAFTSEPRPLCALQSCVPTTSVDYVLRADRVPSKCCPDYIRTACKQGDQEYQVGEKWSSPDGDPCKSYECQQPGDIIVKELQVQSCVTTCSEGWEYRADNSSTECCGSCHQVACVTAEGLRFLDETWNPDLCTKSVCVLRDGRLQVESTREECVEPSQEDLALYAFDKTEPRDRCCALYRKSACLVDGKTRSAGDQWPSDDPCVTLTCVEEADGQVSHQKVINACPPPTCDPGYEYEAPTPGSSECCGKCVQVACVVDEQVHEVGSYWQPDACTTVFCEGTRGQVFVSRTELQCLNVSACPVDRLEHPPGECCAICKIDPTKVSCQPEPKPLQDTIGYIAHHSTLYGRCVNQEPIRGLTECVGLCQSGTYHETDSTSPSSRCDCCHAESTKEMIVPLRCENGRLWPQRILVATSCSCQPCSGGGEDFEQQAASLKAIGPSARILRGDGIIPRG